MSPMSPRRRLMHRRAYPFAAQTNVGRVRALNEDSILALPPLHAVADGLGGHQAGEIASAVAIDALREAAPRDPDATGLAQAVQAANRAVLDAVAQGIGREGMGTTMTACMIEQGRAVLAQVGDSRAYLLRNRQLTQITEDHSVVGALVRSGHITVEEARVHERRSVITRALGTDPELAVDSFEISVLRGDRLLLCSDGLTAMVDDAHIAEILLANVDPTRAAERLIDAANTAGGADNISVIVIDVTEEQGAQARLHNHHRNRLWLYAALWIVAAILVCAGIWVGVQRYAERQAYLRVDSAGHIYICRGVPGKVLGKTLTFETIETSVTAEMLTSTDLTNLRLSPTYDSVDDARGALDEMVAVSPMLNNNETVPEQPVP
ncbi:MAG: Stp1/IreP family PP2C-type Ser/Thr phosphatase [Actinomycetes bacterium]|nr:Stp1/IreP family PP2C-type Ser/Thr phosphatase [Actinomycetes bacterium]